MMATASLKKMCSDGNSDACIDAGFNLIDTDDSLKERVALYGRACKLGNERGCKAYDVVESKFERGKKIESNEKLCNQGKSQNCMVLSVLYFNEEDIKDAAKFSQLACMHGSSEGCQSATILNQQLAENGRQFDEQQKRELAIQMQRQQQEYDADQRKRDRRAAAFRDLGRSFQQNKPIHCTTQNVGNTGYTDCN